MKTCSTFRNLLSREKSYFCFDTFHPFKILFPFKNTDVTFNCLFYELSCIKVKVNKDDI